MSISCIRLLLPFVFILLSSLLAEGQIQIFAEPSFTATKRLSPSYVASLNVASRQTLYRQENWQLTNRQIEVGHFSTFRVGYANTLSLGLMYRNRQWFEDSSDEVRITAQYNDITFLRTTRLGHRFRAEQRLFQQSTEYRFRYRTALDKPLYGEILDIGEPFIIFTLEWLYSMNKIRSPEADTRVNAEIGWKLSEASKLKFGLQYRLERFNQQASHILFFLPAYTLKL